MQAPADPSRVLRNSKGNGRNGPLQRCMTDTIFGRSGISGTTRIPGTIPNMPPRLDQHGFWRNHEDRGDAESSRSRQAVQEFLSQNLLRDLTFPFTLRD